MNYFPFHIGDYASKTRHLSWEEDAAYRRLLDISYSTERPIPADLRQVFRLVMAQTDSQRDAVETVLQEFFEPTDEGWINRRVQDELAAMQDKRTRQRDKAMKRWHKPVMEPGSASAMPRHEPEDAAASVVDADAMPPIPNTNTNTNTKEEELLLSSEVLRAHAESEKDSAVETVEESGAVVVEIPINPTAAAAVCIALKAAGVAAVNPGNLRLQALVNAGAGVDEFLAYVDKAREAAPGREFSYLLATVENERKRAKSLNGQLGQRPMSKAEEFVSRNFPRIAARRPLEVIDAARALG